MVFVFQMITLTQSLSISSVVIWATSNTSARFKSIHSQIILHGYAKTVGIKDRHNSSWILSRLANG